MFTNHKPLKKYITKNAPALIQEEIDSVPSIISNNLKISGNLNCSGIIEVQGEIEGNINCKHITVHKTGRIKGDVITESIHIEGCVEGMVKSKYISISETGFMNGIVMYEEISISNGGYLEAHCKKLPKPEIESIEVAGNNEENEENEENQGSKEKT